MNTIHYIYELIDPRTDETRYIGESKKGVKRLYGHLKESLHGITYKCNWIKELKNEKLIPIINIIDQTTEDKIGDLETFYINLYKSWGFKLTNIAPGGHRPSSRLGKKNTPEHNANILFGKTLEGKKIKEQQERKKLERLAKGRTLHMITPEARSKAINTRKRNAEKNGFYFSDEHKKNLSKACIDKIVTEKTRQKISNSLKGRVSPRKGIKLSKEQILNIVEKNTGMPNPSANCPILIFDLQENLIKECKSRKEASLFLKVSGQTISITCRGKRKNSIIKNYIVKYKYLKGRLHTNGN